MINLFSIIITTLLILIIADVSGEIVMVAGWVGVFVMVKGGLKWSFQQHLR